MKTFSIIKMIPKAKVFIDIWLKFAIRVQKKSKITNTIDSGTLNNFFVNIGFSIAKKIEKLYDGNTINRAVDSIVLKSVQNDEVTFELTLLVGKKFRLYGFNKSSSKNNCSSH